MLVQQTPKHVLTLGKCLVNMNPTDILETQPIPFPCGGIQTAYITVAWWPCKMVKMSPKPQTSQAGGIQAPRGDYLVLLLGVRPWNSSHSGGLQGCCGLSSSGPLDFFFPRSGTVVGSLSLLRRLHLQKEKEKKHE